jgi:PAP2 superfamily C-terminal
MEKEYFKKGWIAWRKEFWENKYYIFIAVILIILSAFADYYSGIYVSSVKAQPVPDLILNHIGPYNLSPIFSYGYLILIAVLVGYPLIFHISKLPKFLGSLAFLVTIRSFFIIFTHLQSPIDAIPVHFPSIIQNLSFNNDLFFSGHTAIPFLGFLLFENKFLKYFFLIGSITMATVVLLIHRHYSIDVFSAFFITYTSVKIIEGIEKKFKN